MMIGLVWKLDQTAPAPAKMKLGDKGMMPMAAMLMNRFFWLQIANMTWPEQTLVRSTEPHSGHT